MRVYFLILPIVMGHFLLNETVFSADRSSGSNSTRWGITTQKPVEETEDQKDQASGENGELKKNRTDAESGEKEDAGVTIQTKEGENPPNTNIKEKRSDTVVPEKTNEIGNKDSGKSPKKQKEKKAKVEWKNETQKAQCNAYLASLKESFLQARYYSIQGVPCGTAENARKFISQIEQCRRDCPDGFLRRSGYTKRIIRNLSWLEKLGAERCPELRD
jgi:hypothetical protein